MGASISAVHHGASMQPLRGAMEGPPASGGSADWEGIVARVTHYTQRSALQSQNPAGQIQNLSELLRVQADVSRYQLRVELVSKVSESAVASMRKLQQNQ